MNSNPAREALSRAVNRAIAEGAPIIEEKPSLACLKERADAASDAFDAACKPHYCDGRWGYYRAVECGQIAPSSVESAFNAYHDATHAYYLDRDGKRGFLGSRGL